LSIIRFSLFASLLLALSAARALADPPHVTFPNLPASAAKVEGFVPAGWAIESRVDGDLNGDGVPDVALVLRDQDPTNVLGSDDTPDPDGFDTNPRLLAVLFQQPKGGYALAIANHTLIPRPDNPNQDDVLGEGGGIAIAKGKLTLRMRLFMTMGGWTAGKIQYVFRFQDGAFMVIGYDSDMLQRNTGEETAVSVNYLNRKENTTVTPDGEPAKVKWTTLSSPKLLTLDEIGDGMEFDPKP
jgi:hypothetical protein